MVIDSLMMFSDKQSVATGTSQNMIDFGQKDPRTGLADEANMYIVVLPGEGFKVTDIAVDVQHSDDGSTFADLIKLPAVAGTNFNWFAVPMPAFHKRYLRLKYTVTGGSGVLNAMVTTSIQDVEPLTDRELY